MVGATWWAPAIEFVDLYIYVSGAPVLSQVFGQDGTIVDASLVRASSLVVVASISGGGWAYETATDLCVASRRCPGADSCFSQA